VKCAGKYSALLLAPPTKAGSLSQTVANTTPGIPYLLTFTARRKWRAVEKPATLQVTVAGASGSGVTSQSLTDTWVAVAVPFVADSSSVTVSLGFTGHMYIDSFKLACQVSNHSLGQQSCLLARKRLV
jgi:hypothetical protein